MWEWVLITVVIVIGAVTTSYLYKAGNMSSVKELKKQYLEMNAIREERMKVYRSKIARHYDLPGEMKSKGNGDFAVEPMINAFITALPPNYRKIAEQFKTGAIEYLVQHPENIEKIKDVIGTSFKNPSKQETQNLQDVL